MEERQRIKSLANGEPVLQAQEPLLLEHYHCDSPVVVTWHMALKFAFALKTRLHARELGETWEALFWHQIMGIFSISTNGRVVVADSCGVKTFSIAEADAL